MKQDFIKQKDGCDSEKLDIMVWLLTFNWIIAN